MKIIETFQRMLEKDHIKAYIIPTSDYHQSEYVSEYFKARAYMSGFSGSAGTLVITQDDARLWTDGRYFLQAEKELEGSGISLMRMGQKNIPTIFEYLANILESGDTLGFDGKFVSIKFINKLKETLASKTIKFIIDKDYITPVWPNRPALPNGQIYLLDNFFAGEEFASKLKRVREKIAERQSDMLVLTALEDQAWLYNLRGNDVAYTPVFLANTLISQDECILYVDKDKLGYGVYEYLKNNDVKIKPYFDIYTDVLAIKRHKIMLDDNKVNYEIYAKVEKNNQIILAENPTLILKAIKNEIEINNTRLAHIKDGVAVTKFMNYVKHNYLKEELTEIKASEYLYDCRKVQPGFIEPSFNTICGFKEHASMLHYSATHESDMELKGDGFLLVDSGGHYLEGTTDITRTIVLGKVSEEMKKHFTAVLKSVIALSRAVFLKGCKGVNLDILARGPIWNLLLDYRCGTGHGVGHILSVHEGPNGFRWQIVPERNDSAVLLPGMITTNEPGIYLDNLYGIRIENEMLCKKVGESEYGEFLGFETITYAPIDLDAIQEDMLNSEEKEWLNNYHELVFNTLKEYMSGDELSWLTFATRKI